MRDVIGADATRFLDATRMATALLGDSLATNIFLLGYAWQLGIVPVSRAGAAQGDRAERRSGRRQPARVRMGTARVPRSGNRSSASAPRGRAQRRPAIGALRSRSTSAIARRVEFLAAYQDDALAQRYKDAGRPRARGWSRASHGGSAVLTDAVARNYFKLLAIKDEYEVARLYTDGEFERAGRCRLRGRLHDALSFRAAAVGGS